MPKTNNVTKLGVEDSEKMINAAISNYSLEGLQTAFKNGAVVDNRRNATLSYAFDHLDIGKHSKMFAELFMNGMNIGEPHAYTESLREALRKPGSVTPLTIEVGLINSFRNILGGQDWPLEKDSPSTIKPTRGIIEECMNKWVGTDLSRIYDLQEVLHGASYNKKISAGNNESWQEIEKLINLNQDQNKFGKYLAEKGMAESDILAIFQMPKTLLSDGVKISPESAQMATPNNVTDTLFIFAKPGNSPESPQASQVKQTIQDLKRP